MTDVALFEGRIVTIGDCSEQDAVATVDCGGLALAPGFIDVHSHSDELLLADGRALSKVLQGVTTEIGGNCGSSPAPLLGYAYDRKARQAAAYRVSVDWQDFAGFFGALEHSGIACNVGSLVGLGTTRACVTGPDERRLEVDELARQTRLVREAIEQGALGVSSGLIYEPSRYADLDELIACAVAAREGGAARYVSTCVTRATRWSKRSTKRSRSAAARRGGGALVASQSCGPALGQDPSDVGDDRSGAYAR